MTTDTLSQEFIRSRPKIREGCTFMDTLSQKFIRSKPKIIRSRPKIREGCAFTDTLSQKFIRSRPKIIRSRPKIREGCAFVLTLLILPLALKASQPLPEFCNPNTTKILEKSWLVSYLPRKCSNCNLLNLQQVETTPATKHRASVVDAMTKSSHSSNKEASCIHSRTTSLLELTSILYVWLQLTTPKLRELISWDCAMRISFSCLCLVLW
jgi:phage FluMu protein Com